MVEEDVDSITSRHLESQRWVQSATIILYGRTVALDERTSEVRHLRREMGANGLDNLSSGRHDAERRERSTVDDSLIIHEHFVLAIGAVLHLDIDPQVTSQLRRHTGGVKTGQSVRAITNDNPGHFELLP
jgi:hypothetical protein